MIATLKNNKSLTFYQKTVISYATTMASTAHTGISAVAIAQTSHLTAGITTRFNTQLNKFLTNLHQKRNQIADKVAKGLADDPNYTGARNDGVNLAWEYEQADVEMGGNGSAGWNKKQKNEIKNRGKVRGEEGHHQKNVADHPAEQGNPDNIKFYKNRQAHKNKGHNGNFKNSSDGDFIDKDKMLKHTNLKRVFKNELKGIGIAAAIGAGIGFTIGFAVSLAENGVTPDSIKYAFAAGGQSGIVASVQVVVGYGIGRTIGEVATKAIEGVLENLGLTITENISQMCSMGVVGAITIAVFSICEFIRLKHDGVGTKEALIQVGKHALFSISLLAVAIAAQGIWGGPAGLIVSISCGIIFLGYNIGVIIHDRYVAEHIREYTIEKWQPLIAA